MASASEPRTLSVDQALAVGGGPPPHGRLVEAQTIYGQIVALKPDYFDAIHLLGMVARQLGQFDEAVRLLRRALALKPDMAAVHLNLGTALRALGDPAEAARAFQDAVALEPANADAHLGLGAVQAQRRALPEATASLRRAAELRPGDGQIRLALATTQHACGDLDAAADGYERAIALAPERVTAHLGLAAVRDAQGRHAEAIRSYQAALTLEPEHAEALNGLGLLLQQRGNAADAAKCFARAVRVRPDFVAAHVQLGTALGDIGKLDEAAAAYRRAIELRPDLPEPYNNLAGVLREQRKLDAAIATYRRALEVDPRQARVHSNLIFTLDVDERTTIADAQAERRRWYAAHRFPEAARYRDWPNRPDPDRKLRVGYISADFRRHSAAYTFAPVVLGHDRQRYEVVCYSGTRLEDDLTARFKAGVDHWRPVLGMDDEPVARLIHGDVIDILVDLSGHTAGHRLRVFTAKPAPVQVSAWGIVGTGIAEIDYQLSDPIIVPPVERPLFAEQIFDMPCAFAYQPPADAPEPGPLPATTTGAVTFGCLNRFGKVSDRVMALWAHILRGSPGSRLLLKDRLFSAPESGAAALARLEALGIDRGRVVLLGGTNQRGHMEAYRAVDLALDTFPQNGGVTTLEALWMGVPVVSRLGAMPQGRVAASILTALGLQPFIAESDDAYVETALARAADLPALAALRAALRPRLLASPIANAAAHVAVVEDAYRTMWRHWCTARSA